MKMKKKMEERKTLGLQVGYEVEIRDKDGKLLHKEKLNSNSLLKNFGLWLRQWFTIVAEGTYAEAWIGVDITGVGQNFPREISSAMARWGRIGAAVNLQDQGIRIGTGTTSVAPTDYEMATLIEHGSGSGQMVYNAQTIEALEVVGQVSKFRITRVFTNNSGASISVKEIGATLVQEEDGGEMSSLLYLRDVLGSPSSVPDAASFTVRYTFSVEA